MIEKSFVTEIDELCAQRFGWEYPDDNIQHAHMVDSCIREKIIPPNIRYAFFKITMRCNSNCAYCEHAYSRNQGANTEQPKEEIIKVVHQLAKQGVRACSVSGGEPLTYADLDEVIKAFVDNRIQPILLTNGILLPQKLERLYESGLRYVIISIDSFEAAHYKESRGISFDALMKAYQFTVEFKKTHPDLRVNITTVVSNTNVNDVVPLIKKANADGVGVQLTPYHNFINKNADIGVENLTQLENVVGEILTMKKEGYSVLNTQEYLAFFPEFFKGKRRIPLKGYQCKCGYENIYVWPDLSVRSCWSTSLAPIGDLKRQSLEEIWQSNEYRQRREDMRNCRCEGCWLLCTAEFTVTHHNYLGEER